MAEDEFALIRALNERQQRSESADRDVLVGIGDDAAVMDWPADSRLVMSCDAMVEGVHFLRSKDITDVYLNGSAAGYKAVASTISDIAAMGATAKYVTVSLFVPKQMRRDSRWLRNLYEGMYRCANKYEVALVGGDTVSTDGPLAFSLNAVGVMPAHQAPLLRSAAKPGDIVFLTNEVGMSAAGLHRTLERDRSHSSNSVKRGESWVIACSRLLDAHHYPEPQCAAGRLFGGSGLVHALNDVSDGLASEAWEIAEASAAGLLLRVSQLPVNWALKMYAEDVTVKQNMYDWMLYGGEDYQLLGTVAAADWPALQRLCSQQQIAVHAIGEVNDAWSGVVLEKANGSRHAIEKKGYNHFAGAGE